MTEKHKSKYKKPENKKPTYRKDLKDYTLDDKDGGLNPNTTGDAHLTTFRKTDKKMQDDGKMYPTYKDDDRLYSDLENGEYDPKTAAKRLKKRQEEEEKDLVDSVKDKIEKLTKEGKERLVREYIRRKISKVLKEQAAATAPPEEDAPSEEAPTPTEPAATAPPDASPTEPVTAAPAAAPTEPAAATPTTDTTPTADAVSELPPEEKNAIAIQKFVNHLQKETGNISRTKTIGKALESAMKDAEPADAKNFYKLVLKMVAKKYKNVINMPDQPVNK